MAAPEATWQDNVAEFRSGLDDLGRTVWPRVLATAMNRAGWQSIGKLRTYTESAIQEPNAFTKKAWKFTKARHEDGDNMYYQIEANPKQAQYLHWLVSGGERQPGDAATNARFNDMFSWSKQETPIGGADRKYIKKLARQVKREAKRRDTYRSKRKAIVDKRLPADIQKKRLARLKWTHVSKGDPGYFIGTIKGIKGYWKRSERYTADERRAVIAAERNRPGRPNVPTGRSNLPWTRSGSKPELLVALSRETTYRPTFDFYGTTQAAFTEFMARDKLQSSLDYELRAAHARGR